MAGKGKKEEILAAAVSMFARKGYDGTSVARLAQEAGVAKSTILHHFHSKQGLYIAVNKAPYEALKRSMAESVLSEADELEQVLAFFDAMIGWLRGHSDYCRLILRMQMDDLPRSLSGGVKHWNPIMEPVLAALEEGRRSGKIAATRPRMLVMNFSNMILHFFGTLPLQSQLVIKNNRDQERAAEAFQAFMMEHIRQALRP